MIAPLYEAVPPSLYGGTERIVAHLTNALVELGHDVTLFASAEAHTRATLIPVRDQAIRLDLKDLPEVYSRWHDYPLVSISDDQRKPLRSANWLATIHHGLAEGVYSFNKMPSDPYLAFLGRISPEKRPDRAISIAKRLGMRLKIAAKV